MTWSNYWDPFSFQTFSMRFVRITLLVVKAAYVTASSTAKRRIVLKCIRCLHLRRRSSFSSCLINECRRWEQRRAEDPSRPVVPGRNFTESSDLPRPPRAEAVRLAPYAKISSRTNEQPMADLCQFPTIILEWWSPSPPGMVCPLSIFRSAFERGCSARMAVAGQRTAMSKTVMWRR